MVYVTPAVRDSQDDLGQWRGPGCIFWSMTINKKTAINPVSRLAFFFFSAGIRVPPYNIIRSGFYGFLPDKGGSIAA